MKNQIMGDVLEKPSHVPKFNSWWLALIKAAASGRLTSPKGRSNPRVVKRRTKQHPPRKGDEIMNIRQDWTPVIVK